MSLDFLGELERSHRDDKDSGEALVEHVLRILRGLPSRERAVVDEELARLVVDESNELSGVALEVFAREGESKAGLIFPIFRATKSSRWRDQLALALARMGAREFAGPLKEHIAHVLDDAHSAGATELAYLHSIDPNGFYDLAVPYVAEKLTQDDGRALRGLLPLYTAELSSDEGRPMLAFLDRLCTRNASAARGFAALLTDYLSKPWSDQRVGRATAEILKRRIAQWRCS